MSVVKRKHTKNEGLLFCEFIAEKEASGLSEKSIRNYRDVYYKYAKETGSELNKNTVLNWIHQMVVKGVNPISINHYICHLRVFVNWLILNSYIKPFEIKKIKAQSSQLKTVSDEEMKILLKRPPINPKFVDYRTWVIINFIMATGARASTILNLKISDVDFCTKEIRYTHLKNKQIALIPLSSSLERVLKQYLNTWEIGDKFLFPDRFGAQLTLSALVQSLQRYCERRGVRPRRAHSFRHTFAKKFILNGGNAFILQKLLTHNDLAMTRKYVRLFDSELKTCFENVCPLDSYTQSVKSIRKK